MVEIDLSKLLGRQKFHVNSQLAYNRLSFSITILADIRVNEYLFINTKKTIELTQFYSIYTEQLKQPAKIKGFSRLEEP